RKVGWHRVGYCSQSKPRCVGQFLAGRGSTPKRRSVGRRVFAQLSGWAMFMENSDRALHSPQPMPANSNHYPYLFTNPHADPTTQVSRPRQLGGSHTTAPHPTAGTHLSHAED